MTAQQKTAMSNDFSTKLESLNLDSVADILIASNGLTQQRADQAIADYQRYLFLVHKNPDLVLVPTKHIDLVLHTHLSLGVQFTEDCELLFGCSLRHEAGFGNSADTRSAWLTAFCYTKHLFEQAFNCKLTDDPAHCFTMTAIGA